MDKDQLYYLFVNANSVAELALRQAAADIEATTQHMPPPDAQTPTPTDLPSMSLDDLDFGALDGLGDMVDEAADAMSPAGLSEETMPEYSMPTPEGPVDSLPEPGIDAYVNEAYAHRDELGERVESVWHRFAETAGDTALDTLVARLPDDLPPLTGRLKGPQMEQWLERYMTHEPAITELVVAIRQLDA